MHCFLGPRFRKRHGQMVGKLFPQCDALRRETILPLVVKLNQPQAFLANAQCDQGHGFITFAMTPVARAGLPVRVRCCDQQVRGAIAPETAAGREEWFGRVESATDHIAAHTFLNRVTGAVAQNITGGVPGAEAVLQLHKLFREPPGFIIRIVVPLIQTDAHRRAAGMLMEKSDGRFDQFRSPIGSVGVAHEFNG